MSESRAITNYDEAFAKAAAAAAATEQLTGGTFISTKGGVLAFGEEVMPGNQVAVIVLDSVHENTFYSAKYDPNQKAAPICYAFSRDGDRDEMGPHESMQVDLTYFQPQHPQCHGCKWNEWGSAEKGKGKACQNRRRLALIPAGYYQPRRGSRDMDLELYADPKHFQQADIAYMKLPVTSVNDWSKYVNQLSANFQRPPFGVVTRIYLEPHPDWQYTVNFELIDKIPDDIAQTIFARHEEAVKAIIQGYKVPEKNPQPQGSLRGQGFRR